MFPSFSDLFNAFVAKFRESRPDVDPSIKGSWSFAFGRGVASAAYAIVILAKEITKQFNPLTATGAFLDLWASYDNLTRLGASPSVGFIKVFGLNTTIIPSNNSWAGAVNGFLYSNSVASTIQPQDVDITPVTVLILTASGTTITATTNFAHGFVAGQFIQISGAVETDYNGIFAVTPDIFDPNVFTYEALSPPGSSPATIAPFEAIPVIKISTLVETTGIVVATTEFDHGLSDQQYVLISNTLPVIYNDFFQITVTSPNTFEFAIAGGTGNATSVGVLRSVHAVVNVQSDDIGPDTALAANGTLDLQDPISGVETTAVTPDGLQGGGNVETDDALRARILLSRSAQEGIFTNDQIELAAKLINGNTDVFIQNPDSSDPSDPDPVFPGQVRIFILRKNDPLGPIPTGGTLQITKKSIIENAKLPANMLSDDVFVLPPILLKIDITMTNVVPDTASMKQALKNQFNAYFEDTATFGTDLDDDVLRGVAINTQDLQSGSSEEAFIKSFDWGLLRTAFDIISVSDSAGVARFAYSGPLLTVDQSITNSKFPDPVFAITSVVDDGGGFPKFLFAPGPTLTPGQAVVISGFTANPAYNGNFLIAGAGVGEFQVSASPGFGSDEPGIFSIQSTYNGVFLVTDVGEGFYEIDTLSFVSDETGQFNFESDVVGKQDLPVLGTLTVNGVAVT